MSYNRITKKKSTRKNTKIVYNGNGFAIFEKELIEKLLEEHNRLWELENKIENGTLIELPCKYGDTVWFVYETEKDEMFLDEGVIQSFSIDSCGLWFYVIYKSGLTYWHTIEILGERVFLTKAEAEKKLKELSKNP